MVGIIIFAAVVFVMFCPILFNINFYFNLADKKLYVGVHLYNFIKVYGGYLKLYKGGIWFQLSDKKHFILKPKDALRKNEINLKILSGFDLISFYAITECGIEDNAPSAMMLSGALNQAACIIFSILRTNNSALDLKSIAILEENRNVFKMTVRIKYVFNLFLLLLALIKLFLSEVIKNVKKRKQA